MGHLWMRNAQNAGESPLGLKSLESLGNAVARWIPRGVLRAVDAASRKTLKPCLFPACADGATEPGSNRASSLNVNAPAQSVSMGKMDAPSRTTLYTVDALNAACPGLNFFRRTANYANQSQIYQNHEQLGTHTRLHLRMVRSRTTTR